MENIGIIGGADGPTVVFVASRFPWLLFGIGILVVIAIAVVLCKKK